MKLFKSIAFSLIGLLILTTSCKNSKSYAERLKDERRAIDLFIAKNNLNILREFPKDGKFGDDDFYKDPNTGVYFSIITYGPDTTKKLSLRDEIYIRFNEGVYLPDDTVSSKFQNLHIEKYYGPLSSYTRAGYQIPGWIVPLNYNVGHKGRVKLIVPFEMGSSYEKSYYITAFYDKVEYRFEGQY